MRYAGLLWIVIFYIAMTVYIIRPNSLAGKASLKLGTLLYMIVVLGVSFLVALVASAFIWSMPIRALCHIMSAAAAALYEA
jgi:hypothetical protein